VQPALEPDQRKRIAAQAAAGGLHHGQAAAVAMAASIALPPFLQISIPA
jgi:hypothetical protein